MHTTLVKAEALYDAYPEYTVVETRKFAELLVNLIGEKLKLDFITKPRPTLDERIKLISSKVTLDSEFLEALKILRLTGNQGAHEHNVRHQDALKALSFSYKLAQWLDMLITQNVNQYVWKEYQRPQDPDIKKQEIEYKISELQQQLQKSKDKQVIHQQIQEQNQALAEENARLKQVQITEAAKSQELIEMLQKQIEALEAQPPLELLANISNDQIQVAQKNFELSERETREIIDAKLKQAGWEVDTQKLTYRKGIRPIEGKNLAIAEYPTVLNGQNGFADYVLFAGLTPIAVVEAKKQNRLVNAALSQAERYSQGFQIEVPMKAAFELDPQQKQTQKPWHNMDKTYYVPFVYSSNGKAYSHRLIEEGGIWFRDVRDPSYISHALQGFHTPKGLLDKLTRNIKKADDYLETTEILPFNDRQYQREGIKAVENAIQRGQKRCLLAMATGTGKTRLANGMIYRFLQSKRFKRILFLVDRTSLGNQAYDDSFAVNVITQGKTLTQIFTVAELGSNYDENTNLHLATVQSLVARLFNSEEPLPIDFFDCIIIDEAHRGYNLDKEMTEGEESIRDAKQYLSMYKQVLEYFDATLIALTATPALHTTDIFGPPVFTYSFTRAVEEGYLVNYEHPIRYLTQLSQAGIHISAGTSVEVLPRNSSQSNIAELPDDMEFDVSDFNRTVINEEFNRVIAHALAEDLDPFSDAKTLIFCVTDRHADEMKILLDQAFRTKYGDKWQNDLVLKITGSIDKPKAAIERYKKSKYPNIAITVDLLSTGIDVPQICNLVFMRQVRSRVLFEQMLGRATRLCKEIGKTEFRIYDAVNIFDVFQNVNTMKPLVVRPHISITQLIRELLDDNLVEKASSIAIDSTDGVKRTQADVLLDELVQKVNRIVTKAEKYKHHPQQTELRKALADMEAKFGVESNKLPQMLYTQGLEATRDWLKQNSSIFETSLSNIQTALGSVDLPIISDAQDGLVERIVDVDHKRPVDYLQQLTDLLSGQLNQHAAIKAVTTRPSDLSREDLREVDKVLSSEGFTSSEISNMLPSHASNQTYAAQVISVIRRASLGEEPLTVEERYQRGLNKILQKRDWTPAQKKWLERLTKFIAQEVIVDKNMVAQQFAKDGGTKRLSKLLDSDVEILIDEIASSIWEAA